MNHFDIAYHFSCEGKKKIKTKEFLIYKRPSPLSSSAGEGAGGEVTMLIKEKIGTLNEVEIGNREVDFLLVEWYETGKRILHKKTTSGTEVVLKFLKEPPNLSQDDVLYEDETSLIVVHIQPCDVMIIQPVTMYEMAFVCYEIGNKHLPLFFEDDAVLLPYDAPAFAVLKASGFSPVKQKRKLLYPLRTTVLPHAHSGGESLFSKILKLTTSSANE